MVELKHTQKFTNSQTENVCECFQFTYHTLRWKLFPALASHSHTSISVTKQYDVVWFLGFAVRKVSIWYWVCTTNYLVYVTMSSSSDTEMNIPPMVLLEYGFQQQKYEINAMHRYHIQHETEWLLKWLPWQHAAWLVTDGDDLEVSSSRFFGNGRLDSSNNWSVWSHRGRGQTSSLLSSGSASFRLVLFPLSHKTLRHTHTHTQHVVEKLNMEVATSCHQNTYLETSTSMILV